MIRQYNPLVTTCILSYNHEQFLSNAIESAIQQTYANQEVLIIDDGSSDRSLEIANDYARRFPATIRVLTHPSHVNKGISATCNRGLAEARGEYIGWIGSDDVMVETKLANQVRYLQERPAVGMVYSRATLIDESGESLGSIIGDPLRRNRSHIWQVIERNPIPAPTILARKVCFDQVGGFDDALVYGDWEMWVRIVSHWELGFLDECSVLYRVHGKNVSVGVDPKLDRQRKLDALDAILRKRTEIGGRLDQPELEVLLRTRPIEFEKDEALVHLNGYFLACQRGDLSNGFVSLLRAVRLAPSRVLNPRRLAAVGKHFAIGLFKKSN